MPFKLRLVHSALMSFVLCLLMTCWVTFINLGISTSFIAHWLTAFSLSWPAAFVTAFFTGPFILRLAQQLIATNSKETPNADN